MDMVVRRETIRADFAYNMGIKPEEVSDDIVDLLLMEGYDQRFGFQTGGPVYESLEEAIADQKAERLAQNVEMFKSQMDEAPDKPSLEQYIEETKIMQDETPSIEFLDPPVGIDDNTIQMAPPVGVGGNITDEMLMASYGRPVGRGGVTGQLTIPFEESDPMLQLMLEQQLADDLSLNADVSLMEDVDPMFNLKLSKSFANGGTVPPQRGPMSDGMGTLYRSK